MANLSRTEKYKDLRSRLQNDTGNDFQSKELNSFESRLNQIDSNNFAAPSSQSQDDYLALHAREIKEAPKQEPLRRTQHEKVTPHFDDDYKGSANYTAFDNDYLDQYIKEVKQYNLEQGNALSDNTQINVLRQLNQGNTSRYNNFGNSPLHQQQPKEASMNTAKIPFQNDSETLKQSPQLNKAQNDFVDDLFESDENQTPPLSSNMTKEDIMAEVQNLVNGASSNTTTSTAPQNSNPQPASYHQDMNHAYERNFDADRTARQQLLNETTQMRAQLDDYEDNLNEVTDKMRHTNRILNIVLIVLIVALAIILGIVIYWIVLSQGA